MNRHGIGDSISHFCTIEKNQAFLRVGLLSLEKKMQERLLVKPNRGFTRWEQGGGKEGNSSRGLEIEGGDKKINGGGVIPS